MDKDAMLTHILDSNVPSSLLGGAPPASVINNNKFTSLLTAAAAAEETPSSTVDADVQAALTSDPRRPVVLVGPEGSGKTTSLVKLVAGWARGEHLQNFSYVFHFSLRDVAVAGTLSLEALLLQRHGRRRVPPEAGAQILQSPESVLFVFDDLDQWSHSLDPADLCSDFSQPAPVARLVASLLNGALLKGAAFILASRIDACSEVLGGATTVEVLGFGKPQRKEYCKGFFTEGKKGETAWTHMERTLGFYDVCSSPRFCWTVCSVYESLMDAGAALPETLTQLYVAVLVHLVQTLNQDQVYNRDLVSALGRMAARCSLEKRSGCSREEVDSLGLRPFLGSVGVFLRIHGDHESGVFSFHSQLMQDFILAASFFVDTSGDASTEKMLENHKSEFVGLFLSGLSEPVHRRPLEVQLGDLDPDRVEAFRRWLKSSAESALDGYQKAEHLHVYRLLHQTQNPGLVKEVVAPAARTGLGYGDAGLRDYVALNYVATSLGQMEQLNLYPTKNLTEQQAETLAPAMSLSRKIILSRCSLASGAVPHLSSALSGGVTEDLDLSQSRLGDHKFRVLCGGLASCKLQTLNLRSCDLTEAACGDLTSALTSGSCQLRVLDLAFNEIGDRGFTKLCRALQSPLCRLQELRLLGCKLSAASMEALAVSLCSGESALRKVELRNNAVGDRGVEALCRGLLHPLCRLHAVDLYDNELTAASCRPLMEAMMASHSSLTELDLSLNALGQEGAMLLCQALRQPGCPMEKLSLKRCELTESVFRELSAVLRTGSSRLKALIVGMNVKGDHQVKSLWDAVAHPGCVLEELDVEMSELTDACVPDVCAAIAASTTLKVVELRNNLLTDASVPALVRAVQASSSMKEMILRYNDFSEDVFEELDECEKIEY